MVINQKQKGKRVELDIVHWLKDHGCDSARRTQQFAGTEGPSDILCPTELPDWHIECKGTKSSLLTKSQLLKWHAQITKDCPVAKQAVILNKSNGKELVALIPFDVWMLLTYERTQFQVEINIRESILLANLLEEAKAIREVYAYLNNGLSPQPYAIYYILSHPSTILVGVLAEEWIRLALLKK